MPRFLLFCFLLTAQAGLSQRIVDITYRQNAKGAYEFSAVNHAFCHYMLELRFTAFDNLRANHALPYFAEIKPGVNPLFTLSPVNREEPVKFNYSSHFYKGCMHPAVDTDFVYLLPIGPGKETQVYEMSGPGRPEEGEAGVHDWYVLRMRMKPGDTIYAARRGVVTEVDDSDGSNDAGRSGGTENYVEVVHADCSFARYGILRKGSALVKPGQPVRPGQPLGLVGGDAYGRGSEVRFSVYYPQLEDLPQNGASAGIYRNYVQVLCWTKNNGKSRLKHGAVYSSEFPAALLNLEAPKKKANKPKRS
jgi:murein DD-endopeptidase MepM/ murein hydrolase activator NlpD